MAVSARLDTSDGSKTRAVHVVFNWDVLLVIMGFIPPYCVQLNWERNGDLLSFLRTCRTLYHAGARFLLEGPIHPPMELHKITSLCQYISTPGRARHLRDLCLHRIRSNDPEALLPLFDDLSNILKQINSLNRLFVDDLEFLLEKDMDDKLSLAITSLTTVEEVAFSCVGPRAARMMAAMNSPVAAAAVSLYSGNRFDHDDTDYDLALMLAKFSQHLEYLHLTSDSFELSLSCTTQFPGLCDLDIRANEFPDVEALVYCFPNLESLSYCNGEEGLDGDSEIEELHQQNQSVNTQSWDCLDRLECSVCSVYAMSLTMQVRVWHCLESYNTQELAWLHTVLGDIQPSVFTFKLQADQYTLDQVDQLSGLFSACNITHLSLTINLDNYEDEPADLLWVLGDSLYKLSLAFLVIKIEYDDDGTRARKNDDGVDCADAIQDYLEEMAVETYIQE